MSNQIVISSGAKVRDLDGVLTGTSGIVNSVPLGGANGVATLDSLGKVPLSQLPASVVTYLGTWNAATNTPTLVNGTGDTGDLYICNVAGTVNFGAGPITFAVGDWVIYSGTIWQKSSGASGTVTSVAMTTPSGLSVSGSPITTSGTLALSLSAGYTIPLSTQLVPTGGTTGQILAKNSNTAYDTTWIDNYADWTEQIRDTVKASVVINKGQAVYISGANGTNQLVSLASNTSEATSSKTLGLAMQNFAINDIGQIVTEGLLGGLNTSTATAGDPVWLGTSGNLIFGLANKPAAPAHLVYIGVVTRVNSNNGEIYVKIQNGFELQELHNVSITSPANGNILQYDSATSLWKNVAGTTTNIAEGTNLYYTDARARGSLSFVAGSGAYNSTTGVITIPTNNTQIINGAGYITLGSLSASSPLSYNSGTGAFSISQANTTTNGYLSSTDWNTFNSKQSALTFSSPLVNTSGTISIPAATSLVNGYLTSSDWSTFNSKQSAITLTTTGTSGAATFIGNTLNIPNYGSALSGYVPYTGATGNVNLGSNDIKASNLIGENSFNIKHLTSGVPSLNGYTTMSAYADSLAFAQAISAGNLKTFSFDLSNLSNSGVYTYTLPIASGTFALLESTQTFTGAKTFSTLASFTSTSGTNTKYGIYLSKGFNPTAFSTTTTNIYSDVTTNNLVIRDSNSTANLVFNNSTQTYTFPAATGTIALTSNLSSYLPLSGGTMTGSILLNNNQTISGQYGSTSTYYTMLSMTPANKVQIDAYGLGVIFGGTIGSGAYTYTLPSATGTLALTSDLSSYVPTSRTLTINGTAFDLSLNRSWSVGTVTSVAALTLGTSGTDLSSSVATGTTTPVITLNVPTASATNRGALSSADWTTFNNKQNALTNPVTGTGTTNYHAKFTGTSALGNSLIWDNGTNVGVGNTNTTYTFDVTGTGRFTGAVNILTSSAGYNSPSLLVNAGSGVSVPLQVIADGGGRLIRFFNSDYNNSNTGTDFRIGFGAGSGNTYTNLQSFTSGETGYGNIALNADGGKVGIGTSSPIDKLTVYAAGQAPSSIGDNVFLGVANDGGAAGTLHQIGFGYNNGSAGNFYPAIIGGISESSSGQSNEALFFATRSATTGTTRPTERMRITSGGVLQMSNNSTTFSIGSIAGSQRIQYGTSGYTTEFAFINSGDSYTPIGASAFNTRSDYRLKEDLKDFKATDLVSSMKVYDFKWKNKEERNYGFMAHELQEVVPYVVTGTKDGMFEDEPQYQGLDYSKLVPVLVKAIQELSSQNQELKERLDKAGL